ncbi:hypothetical protein, partial [Dokdonella sp.]|uniref:hypothetical protein n=1 Tax=Dokdonella sp. TaxID=2291710 RepID=UPI003C6A9135
MRHAAAMIFCLCALLSACGSQSQELIQPETGVISEGEYRYAPIGWRMSIPWRWDVLSEAEVKATTGKGRDLFEMAAGEELVDLETQLLYLSYGARNRFTSSVSPFDVSLGSEQEQVAETIKLILEAYQASNLHPRLAKHETETIDGIRFDL